MTRWRPWLLGLLVVVAIGAALWASSKQLRSSWLLFGAHPEVAERLRASLDAHRAAAEGAPGPVQEQARAEFEKTTQLLQRLRILELSREAMLERFRLWLTVVLAVIVALIVGGLSLRQRRNRTRLARLEVLLEKALVSEHPVDAPDRSNDLLGRIGKTIARLSSQTAGARRRRKALEVLRNWQEGARVVAHEMKTPLTSLRLDIASLAKARLAPPHAATAERARGGLDSIEDFVARYTEMARLPVPRPARHALDEFVSAFVDQFGAAWAGSTLHFSRPPECEALLVLLDSDVTRRVLHNLCENAVLAGAQTNPARGVTIRFRVEPSPSGARLLVEDDGPGIPEEIRAQLFAPYVSKGSGARLGLGLPVSRKMMIDQGGDLSLARSAHGARFLVEFAGADALAVAESDPESVFRLATGARG